MKRFFFAALCCVGVFSWSQETPQLDALAAALQHAYPVLPSYAPNYQKQEAARRERLEWLRSQVDTLDIPEAKRYRIMRDLYRGRGAYWLEKYRLSTQPLADSLPGNLQAIFHK